MKLIDYIRGDRRGPEAHRTELDAMTDPFLHEAFEGYDTVKGDHAEALERLLDRVRTRTETKSRLPLLYWSAASVGLLLLLAGGLHTLSVYIDGARLSYDDPSLLATVIAQGGRPAEFRKPAPEETEPETTRTGAERKTVQFVPPVVAEDEELSETAELMVRSAESAPAAQERETADVDIAFSASRVPDRTTAAADQNLTAAKVRRMAQEDKEIRNSSSASSQTRSVSGRVTDANGRPLGNVMVLSEKKQRGVMTDRNGYFRMEDLPESDYLVAALLGYESHRIGVPENSTSLSIVMRESPAGLDEVVTIGYGTSKSRDVTGSVSAPSVLKPEAESPANGSQTQTGLTLEAARERFTRYAASNLVRPVAESGQPVKGTVIASFRVGSDGRPNALRIEQSLSPAADREAQRLIRGGPDWPSGEGRVRVTIEF